MKTYFKSFLLCGMVLCSLSAQAQKSRSPKVNHNFAGMEGEQLMSRFGAFKKTPKTKVIQLGSIDYLKLGYFFDNRAFVYTKEDGIFCIDAKGNKLKSWKGEEAEQLLAANDMQPRFSHNRVMITRMNSDYSKTAIIYDTLFREIKRFENVYGASSFVGGIACYRKDVQVKSVPRLRNFFVDINGNEVLKNITDVYSKQQLDAAYINTDMRPVCDNLMAFCVPKPENFMMRLWGFCTPDGKIVVPAKYDKVQNFSHGMAAVATGEYDNAKWGFIDTKGRMVIAQKFSREPSPFDACGLAMVIDREDRRTYMDKKGQILPNRYDNATPFVKGLALCSNSFDDSCALIDSAQHVLTTYGFEMVSNLNTHNTSDYYPEYQVAKSIADEEPNVIIHDEKLYVQVKDAGYGLLDNKGNLVMCGLAGYFSCGIAPVLDTDKGLAGYVNDKGEWVVQFVGSEF